MDREHILIIVVRKNAHQSTLTCARAIEAFQDEEWDFSTYLPLKKDGVRI
jgi:hypothetical protein